MPEQKPTYYVIFSDASNENAGACVLRYNADEDYAPHVVEFRRGTAEAIDKFVDEWKRGGAILAPDSRGEIAKFLGRISEAAIIKKEIPPELFELTAEAFAYAARVKPDGNSKAASVEIRHSRTAREAMRQMKKERPPEGDGDDSEKEKGGIFGKLNPFRRPR